MNPPETVVSLGDATGIRICSRAANSSASMRLAVLDEIALAPIKGCRLLHPSAADVAVDGIVDDRRFFLVDADGRMVDARAGGLLRAVADWNAATGCLRVRFPGGVVDEEVRLGAVLDGRVVWDRDRRVAGREVLGEFSQAFSELTGRKVRLAEQREGERAIDAAAITLVSLASIDSLEAAMGGVALGTNRFRMSLTLGGCEAHAEDGWYGRRIDVGTCRLRVGGPVPRCVAITHHPRTGVRDKPVLKGIVKHRGRTSGPPGAEVAAAFGVYAEVERAGRVAVGDPVVLSG